MNRDQIIKEISMNNIDEQADPTESYVAPARTFHGMELKPYSLGNKMLLAMITREGDPNSFFLLSLLYVLTQDRSRVQKESANKDQVRENVLEWLDTLELAPQKGDRLLKDGASNPNYVPSEQEKAEDLAIEILQEASKEKVDPITTASGNA